MRQPPTYTVWKITCRSSEEAEALRQWLSSRIDLDRVLTDAVRAAPGGVEQVQTVPHRLGDYFAAIRLLPDSLANPASFRLVFHRRPEAGRFWKDLMVNILQEVESAPQKASIALDAKGETEPTSYSEPGARNGCPTDVVKTSRPTMTFDPSTILGTPNTWLETRVRYEGVARAEFTNPPGVIEGPATVNFNAAGACRVRITVEKIEAPDRENFSLRIAAALGTYLVHGEANPCTSLTVRTDRGVFTGGDRIIHGGLPPDGKGQVELRPLQSRFEAAGAAPAKYWVLPLANLMPDPWSGDVIPELANHPLRLRSSPTIPEDLPEGEKVWARSHVYFETNIFTFLLNGEPGFIERMPDYDKRVKWVRRRRSRRVTAVMVGPAHVQSVDWSDYEGLFPLDILSMLSLATGTPVGAPWIEFRDEKGVLVRRVHICFGAARYAEAHAVLNEHLVRNGPGYLVGKVLAAPDRAKKYLRAAINHALAAKGGTLENRFISLCRGLETLCRHHKFINQNLAARLDSTQQAAVKTILKEAEAKLRALQQVEADPDRRAVLNTIASRSLGAAQTEKSFGLAVADLAQKFGFHDAQVVDAHLSAHPHPTGKTWPEILTHYRAAATHDAYFDFARREDLYDIMRVMNHLHDLLLRVLLKIVGYDGPYESPIPPVMQRDSVDWVKPTTAAGWLGYA